MRTLRSSYPFELFDRLEHQLSQQLHSAERVPAAEVHETPEAYDLVLELPGVDKAAIEVKATERTLLISAERRSQRQQSASPEPGSGGQPPCSGAAAQRVPLRHQEPQLPLPPADRSRPAAGGVSRWTAHRHQPQGPEGEHGHRAGGGLMR
jgi:hypothetical protein